MNYLALRNEVIGSRFDASQDANVKNWMATAYAKVWNAAKWQFAYSSGNSFSVSAGNAIYGLPSDFGDRLRVWDQYGDPLVQLSNDDFETLYRYGITQGITGVPEAFKVDENRQLILGPGSQTAATFKISYKRRICHFLADGSTVNTGPLSLDTDVPMWDSAHHMVLVYATMEIGQGLETDISGIFSSSLYQDALAAMISELALTQTLPRQWGAWA